MYLKTDYLIVELDGKCQLVSFHDTIPRYELDPDAISGWFDGPGTKASTTPRPTSWGDFTEPAYKNSRLITVTGTAIARNNVELQEMRDDLMSVYSDGTLGEIRVLNGAGTRYAYVRMEGTPRWVQLLDNAATWKLELYAPDPRIYGLEKRITLNDSTVSGGLDYPLDFPIDFESPTPPESLQIFNNGNVEAWPKFVVTGDYYSGFEITNGNSKKIRYEGMVTQAAPVTIDLGAGTAIQNGVDNSNLLSRRDWFSIPPNSSIQPMFYPIQDAFGWCDILYRDTWI